jgi:zinc/manganese transport system substrate-binding protein
MLMRKISKVAFAVVVITIVGTGIFVGSRLSNGSMSSSNSAQNLSTKMQIVAAENFWGSLVSQLGGAHVQVLSIVTDPNADPHEYESNMADARAVANARYVIVNGAGYDDWALLLISANSSPNQKVLNVANLLGKKTGDNPHFWYYPLYVNETVHQMYSDLVSLDPANAAYYKQQYVNLNASLGVYNERIDDIRQHFAGTEVASTESIFVYLADATGLDLVSPPAFMEAVSEGNEPSQPDIRNFTQQLESGNVSVLVYNEQTATPTTSSMMVIATENNVTVVPVTETIQPLTQPPITFQEWMNAELISLYNALNEKTLVQ